MMYGNNAAAPQQQHSNDIYENNQAKNEKLQYVRKMQEKNDNFFFSRNKRNHLSTKTTKKDSNPSTYVRTFSGYCGSISSSSSRSSHSISSNRSCNESPQRWQQQQQRWQRWQRWQQQQQQQHSNDMKVRKEKSMYPGMPPSQNLRN